MKALLYGSMDLCAQINLMQFSIEAEQCVQKLRFSDLRDQIIIYKPIGNLYFSFLVKHIAKESPSKS